MHWRNVPDHEYSTQAQAYHAAAKKLARLLDVDADPSPIPDLDLCPVLSLYRHALELHLKIIVLGEGANFLPARPDVLSVSKSHSLAWLAQFVTQIVTALHWEDEFRTEGIDDLAAFKDLIAEANEIDAPYRPFRSPIDPAGPAALKTNLLQFLRRLDALLELLDQTADSLAAEWYLHSHPPSDEPFVH